MEERLQQAITVAVVFESPLEENRKIRGRLLIGKNRQVRIFWRSAGEAPPILWRDLVSDGENMVERSLEEPARAAPGNLRESVLVFFARAGLLPLFPFRDPDCDLTKVPKEFKDSLVISEQLWLGEEHVGARRASKLSYLVMRKGTPAGYRITLWLDSTTALPIKRRYVAINEWSPDGRHWTRDEGEEIYTEFRLNTDIGDAEFSLKDP